MARDDVSEMALAPLREDAALADVSLSHKRILPAANALYLTAAQVRIRYGGMSDMALWRWLQDEKLGFPRPLRINRRRFWKEGDLIAWENTRVAADWKRPE